MAIGRNGKVILNTPFKKIYVQAAAGDAGGAIGAALTTWYSMDNVKDKKQRYYARDNN